MLYLIYLVLGVTRSPEIQAEINKGKIVKYFFDYRKV